ncbi:MAG TPA: hypothetical protein VFM02_02900 [Candidatus Paceibacterota bacterium]|nr:hypothetical protein [Candidatus Paceibacterota bacterium]
MNKLFCAAMFSSILSLISILSGLESWLYNSREATLYFAIALALASTALFLFLAIGGMHSIPVSRSRRRG